MCQPSWRGCEPREGVTARALEFTILTAARTGETLGAKFAEFDGKAWTIPGERMKTGEPHRVPLCPRAIAIVKDMTATRLNDLLFPGIKRGEPLSQMAMLMLLRELRPGITVHGFRSSFRDWCRRGKQHAPRHCRGCTGTFARQGACRLSAWRSVQETHGADAGMGQILRAANRSKKAAGVEVSATGKTSRQRNRHVMPMGRKKCPVPRLAWGLRL